MAQLDIILPAADNSMSSDLVEHRIPDLLLQSSARGVPPKPDRDTLMEELQRMHEEQWKSLEATHRARLEALRLQHDAHVTNLKEEFDNSLNQERRDHEARYSSLCKNQKDALQRAKQEQSRIQEECDARMRDLMEEQHTKVSHGIEVHCHHSSPISILLTSALFPFPAASRSQSQSRSWSPSVRTMPFCLLSWAGAAQ